MRDRFEGKVVANRFCIGKMIDTGGYGRVYKVKDLKKSINRKLVIKICMVN